jgi:hypothetical protein
MSVSQGFPQPPVDREAARARAVAQLRQATWQAVQFLSYDEVREYVAEFLREVETDEP